MEEPPQLSRLRELSDELASMVVPTGTSLTLQHKGGQPVRSVSIYALTRGALTMLHTGLETWPTNHLAAMPMFRFSWEAAITAQWLANTETGSEALINEQLRLRKAAHTDALISPMFSQGVSNTSADIDALATAVQDAGRNFRSRCMCFVDGAGLYVIYRLMSGYCHAGAAFVEEWVEKTDDDQVAIRDISRLEEKPSTSWPSTGVIAGMWAARTFDFFTPGRPNRSRLRQIAGELGAVEHLKVLPEVRQAEANAIRSARHSQWKGPSSSGDAKLTGDLG